MVKYKVNLKFQETGNSLNETIINILKIKLEKHINNTYNNLKIEVPPTKNNYFQSERNIN